MVPKGYLALQVSDLWHQHHKFKDLTLHLTACPSMVDAANGRFQAKSGENKKTEKH